MSARRCCTALGHRIGPVRPRSSALHHLRPIDHPILTLTQTRAFALTRASYSRDPAVSSSSSSSSPSYGTDGAQDGSAPAIQHFASKLRQSSAAGAAATEPYVAYGTTEKMYAACAAAGDYTLTPPAGATMSGRTTSTTTTTTAAAPAEPTALPALKTATGEDVCYPLSEWHSVYSLPPTFATWSQLTFLHMHILTLRIRTFPPAHAKRWNQNLLDHFFYAAEDKMTSLHGLTMRGVRTKYLKDLFEQRRGAEISYDEGLVRGDATLATAVWRNVFQARDDVDATHLAEVTAWMRRAAAGLARLDDAEFASARWRFGVPWEGREAVDVQA